MSLFWLLLDVMLAIVTSALTSILVLRLALRRPPDELAELLWSREKGRPRKRYLVFEVASGSEVKEEDVRVALEEAYRRLFGEAGLAAAGLRLILYDAGRRRGIVRVRSSSLPHLLAAIGLVRRIGEVDALIVPLRTAGTIRKARKYVYQ
ncbi:MAG: Rpp14/Pop5 family protein [Acidilobus sp.]